ncbi:hypothetical protein PFDG_05090, partial [Plasmodium falciparum Dd2]
AAGGGRRGWDLPREGEGKVKRPTRGRGRLSLPKKTRYDKRDTDMYNYLEDYEDFDEEYDF